MNITNLEQLVNPYAYYSSEPFFVYRCIVDGVAYLYSEDMDSKSYKQMFESYEYSKPDGELCKIFKNFIVSLNKSN